MLREEKRNFTQHVVPVISSNYLDPMMNLECNFDLFLEIAPIEPAALAIKTWPAVMTSSFQRFQWLFQN